MADDPLRYALSMPDAPPHDAADYAEDFSRRYAHEMAYLVGDRMAELGIPTNQIGSRVPGSGHAVFLPDERTGGGNDSAGGRKFAVIHELTIGHLDPAAILECRAVVLRVLDDATISRVLASFPGLKVAQRDGYLVAPWHGREDAERGEAFAARIKAETGCLVADRRNGRVLHFAAGGDVTAGAGDQRPTVPRSDGPPAVSRRWP